jgi:hypothetical protein
MITHTSRKTRNTTYTSGTEMTSTFPTDDDRVFAWFMKSLVFDAAPVALDMMSWSMVSAYPAYLQIQRESL